MKTSIKLGKGCALVVQPSEDGSEGVSLSFSGDGRESSAVLTMDAVGALLLALEKSAEVIDVRAAAAA